MEYLRSRKGHKRKPFPSLASAINATKSLKVISILAAALTLTTFTTTSAQEALQNRWQTFACGEASVSIVNSLFRKANGEPTSDLPEGKIILCRNNSDTSECGVRITDFYRNAQGLSLLQRDEKLRFDFLIPLVESAQKMQEGIEKDKKNIKFSFCFRPHPNIVQEPNVSVVKSLADCELSFLVWSHNPPPFLIMTAYLPVDKVFPKSQSGLPNILKASVKVGKLEHVPGHAINIAGLEYNADGFFFRFVKTLLLPIGGCGDGCGS